MHFPANSVKAEIVFMLQAELHNNIQMQIIKKLFYSTFRHILEAYLQFHIQIS